MGYITFTPLCSSPPCSFPTPPHPPVSHLKTINILHIQLSALINTRSLVNFKAREMRRYFCSQKLSWLKLHLRDGKYQFFIHQINLTNNIFFSTFENTISMVVGLGGGAKPVCRWWEPLPKGITWQRGIKRWRRFAEISNGV